AALTMFAGNLGALVQTNMKRLLAYSSIAHAGYILVAFAAVTSMAQGGSEEAAPAYAAVLFYLLSYALVKLGAFTIVSQLAGAGPVPFPIGVNAVLLITFVGTILFGVYPNPVINFILRPSLLAH